MTLVHTYLRTDENEINSEEDALNHVGTSPFETDLLFVDCRFYNDRVIECKTP